MPSIMWNRRPPPKRSASCCISAFFVADHATHFYVLGGPDFVVGPEAPKAERNILGVMRKVGREIGAQVMQLLKENHEVVHHHRRALHPSGGSAGGRREQTPHRRRTRAH